MNRYIRKNLEYITKRVKLTDFEKEIVMIGLGELAFEVAVAAKTNPNFNLCDNKGCDDWDIDDITSVKLCPKCNQPINGISSKSLQYGLYVCLCDWGVEIVKDSKNDNEVKFTKIKVNKKLKKITKVLKKNGWDINKGKLL